VPPEFKVGKEFSPDHWVNKIDHNTFVWLEEELYEKFNFYFAENNTIQGTININDKEYKVYVDTFYDDDDNYYKKLATIKGTAIINNNKIQLVYNKNNYKLYDRVYDISFLDPININEINNKLFFHQSIIYGSKTYHVIFNDKNYNINMTLVKKDKETILNDIKEYIINEKPCLEYDGNGNNWFTVSV
jgi:hypothetical protein